MAEEKALPWQVDEAGSPRLRGMRCSACGMDAFPAQNYGCIRCGATGDQLVPRELATQGKLLSFAVVRTHPTHPVPFTMGEIQLDAGPIVRAQLSDATPLEIGQRVSASVEGENEARHLEFVEEPAP